MNNAELSFDGLFAHGVNSIAVTTLDDTFGDKKLSLRDAISMANATPEDDVIRLAHPGTYAMVIEGAAEDDNATGDYDVQNSGAVHSIAPSKEATIDAKGIDRVFDLQAGASLSVTDILITGGKAPDSGGIRVTSGSPELNGSSSMSGNTATNEGGWDY